MVQGYVGRRVAVVAREIDIYRSANVLVKHHGEDAPIHAAMRADAMLEAGDQSTTRPSQ